MTGKEPFARVVKCSVSGYGNRHQDAFTVEIASGQTLNTVEPEKSAALRAEAINTAHESEVSRRVEEAVRKLNEALVLKHYSCCSDGGCDIDCPGFEDAKISLEHLQNRRVKEAVEEAVRLSEAYNEDLKRRLVAKDKAVKEAVAKTWGEAAKIADNLGAEDARNAILFRSRASKEGG